MHLEDGTGEERVEAIETSKEITRGFSTLLRQFDGKGEPASFLVVSGRLRKVSGAETDGLADALVRSSMPRAAPVGSCRPPS